MLPGRGRKKNLTETRIQRAMDAMVELIECDQTSWQAKQALNNACDLVRKERANIPT